MKIALLGNPNTGKTTVFNHLTDSYAYVGNWNGVTVEKKIGEIQESEIEIIDLPGIYSLNPLTKDESVATTFLLQESFSEIVNVVNAAQLKRNLLLTIELLEYGKPVTLILNMMDIVKKQELELDFSSIERALHTKVLTSDARTSKGLPEVRQELFQHERNPLKNNTFFLDYGPVIEEFITHGQDILVNDYHYNPKFSRWFMIQFFAGNKMIDEFILANNFVLLTHLKQ